MSAFLHSWRTFTSRSSISKMSATRRSCWRAIWNGFSRRWDSGASTVVTQVSFGLGFEPRKNRRKQAKYRTENLLLDPEPDRLSRGGTPGGRPGEEADRVRTARQQLAVRVAAGQAERVRAGHQIAQASEQAETLAASPELDVQPGQRP